MVRLRIPAARLMRLLSRAVVITVAAGSALLPGGVANAGAPAATTTTLNVTAPAGPSGVAPDTVETLVATVSPPASGSVQFKDGSVDIGPPVIVSDGVVSSTMTLSPATHSLTAVFTSNDPAFNGSTSPTVPYVVAAAPGVTATTTTLRVIPGGTTRSGSVVVLANVAPLGAAGTIQFFDGATALEAPAPATAGFALLITKLPAGPHSLAAVFTPTNQVIFVPSASLPVVLTVAPKF